MKIAIHINKHMWVLSLIHGKELTVEELLAKHAQEPNQGLAFVPVEQPSSLPKDNVSSSETEIHGDSNSGGYQIRYPVDVSPVVDGDTLSIKIEDGIAVGTVNKELEQTYISCQCIALPNLACDECKDSLTEHSGGCSRSLCINGMIPLSDSCFCTRPGYILCFECTIDMPHSAQCANCDGSTFIPKYS